MRSLLLHVQLCCPTPNVWGENRVHSRQQERPGSFQRTSAAFPESQQAYAPAVITTDVP